MMGKTTWTKALTALAATSLAFAAQAGPGDGIRLGGSDARLHPFVDLETRYDSNVTYTTNNTAVGDLVLHVRPGLELKALGDMASIEFSGNLDWAQYLGLEGDTTSLSNVYAQAALAAAFNRSGAVSPRLDNSFQRTISTSSLTAAASAVISNANTLTLSIPWKPGGGALMVGANAQWLVESYEKYSSLQGFNASDLNYSQYRVGGEAQWRFLPRTTGLFQIGWYNRQQKIAQAPGNADGYDVVAGLTGLVSQRVATTAKIGFGSISADAVPATVSPFGQAFPASTTSSFLADVAVEWLPLETLSLKAGYKRSLGLDPTVSTYITDGVSAGASVKLADRIAFKLGARWDHFDFQQVNGATTAFLRVDPTIEGSWGRWLNVALGYVYSMRSAQWPSLGGAPPDYSKNEVFLRGGVTY
jgi:hypothetical protein